MLDFNLRSIGSSYCNSWSLFHNSERNCLSTTFSTLLFLYRQVLVVDSGNGLEVFLLAVSHIYTIQAKVKLLHLQVLKRLELFNNLHNWNAISAWHSAQFCLLCSRIGSLKCRFGSYLLRIIVMLLLLFQRCWQYGHFFRIALCHPLINCRYHHSVLLKI